MKQPTAREAFLAAMTQRASRASIAPTMPQQAGTEPLLICVYHRSPAAAGIADNGVFCVNVLPHDEAHRSGRFVARAKAAGGGTFSWTRWPSSDIAASAIASSLFALASRVMLLARVGTQQVVFGAVWALHAGGAPGPLPGSSVTTAPVG